MKLDRTLHRITEVLLEKKGHWDLHSGLLSGYSGVILYLAYYNSIYKNQEVDRKLLDLSGRFQDEFTFDNIRFSDGLTGGLFAFSHISQHLSLSLIESEFYIHFLNEVNKYQGQLLSSKNLDLLHGLLGLQLSLEKMGDKCFSQELDSLVLQMAEKSAFGVFWYESFEPEEKIFNTSMAHGQASMINYLSARYLSNKGSQKAQIRKHVYEAIDHLFSTRLLEGSSQFPSIIMDGVSSSSRLAWCYGDLSIACSFLYAANVFHDHELEKQAVEIAKCTLTRKTPKETGINDLGFCHGSSGLVQMYTYFYRSTNNISFYNASRYWLDFTLSNLFREGLLYKAFDSQTGWHESYGLLNGLAGIGLTLISCQFPAHFAWEEVFYLKAIRDGKARNNEGCSYQASATTT